MDTWKAKAKDKLNTYKQALKQTIEDRNYTEWVLKEKLENERIEREKVEKEKEFLFSEKKQGEEDLMVKQKALDDLWATYDDEKATLQERLD